VHRLFLFVVVAVACVAQTPQESPAPKTIDPAKRAAIEELFSLMKMDQLMEAMKSQIEPMMSQAIQKSAGDMTSLAPDQRAIFAKEMPAFMKQLMGVMWDRVSLEKLKPEFVKIYDETFTLDEINGTVAFYKSPAGAAMIEKLPQVTGRVMSVTQQLMGDVMPEIMKRTEAWQAEMKKKYGDSLNEK
jgi:uncharacterized protein